jgi:hypothetical protein
MTDEELEICERGLEAVIGHYGMLVAKSSDGYVSHAATATFLRVDGKHFIITAHHVIAGLARCGNVRLQLIGEEAVKAAETANPPIELDLAIEQHLALPAWAGLDIAVLRAPAELYSFPHIGWFDINLQLDIVSQIRDHVSEIAPQRLACMILGFPNYSRFVAPDDAIQLFGALPLWASFERFDAVVPLDRWWSAKLTGCSCNTESPDHFDDLLSATDRTPQMVLKVESPLSENLSSNISPLTRLSAANFSQMVALAENQPECEPFGGYSWGPIMYFCENGNYLTGIIKQGNAQFLSGPGPTRAGTVSPEISVGYGVPIDVIVHVIRSYI